MAEELTGITEVFDAFALSLAEGRYYDAHEDLEPIWFPRRFEESDEVLLWKGFINAAVCFELIKRGRPKPAEVAWQTYLKYRARLEHLETEHYEMYVRIVKIIEKLDSSLRGNDERESEYV